MLSRKIAEQMKVFSNPVDLIQQVVYIREWEFSRKLEGELTAKAEGAWCDYQLLFEWCEEVEAMMFSASYVFSYSPKLHNDVCCLIAEINKSLWLGHFSIKNNEISFRYSVKMTDGDVYLKNLAEEIIDTTISSCEHFYPTFKAVIDGGASVENAMNFVALDNICGNA